MFASWCAYEQYIAQDTNLNFIPVNGGSCVAFMAYVAPSIFCMRRLGYKKRSEKMYTHTHMQACYIKGRLSKNDFQCLFECLKWFGTIICHRGCEALGGTWEHTGTRVDFFLDGLCEYIAPFAEFQLQLEFIYLSPFGFTRNRLSQYWLFPPRWPFFDHDATWCSKHFLPAKLFSLASSHCIIITIVVVRVPTGCIHSKNSQPSFQQHIALYMLCPNVYKIILPSLFWDAANRMKCFFTKFNTTAYPIQSLYLTTRNWFCCHCEGVVKVLCIEGKQNG